MTEDGAMVGFVVVTHGNLATELIAAAEMIVGNMKKVRAVPIGSSCSPEKAREDIIRAIDSVDSGGGAIILTDLFGGTPSNLSISFLEEKKIEVVTGVNLPMMIKLNSIREAMDLDEMARFIKSYGRENITVAGELLKGDAAL